MCVQRHYSLIFCLLIFGLSIGLIMGLCWQLSFDLAAFSPMQKGKSSHVLDDEGNVLCTFAVRQHIPITFDQVPPVVWQAFVAIEDRAFFQHNGFSWRGIIRSMWANIKQFKKAQGASTITQQVVRLLFLHNKKTYWRKCVELVYTVIIECFFSKEQILESYLNNIYFGGGMYGIAAAAEGCWGVTVDQLNYEQAALLAGVIRSPSYYCPLYKLEHAQKRKNVVLQAMMDCKFITLEQYNEAINRSVDLSPPVHDAHILYIKNMIYSACVQYGIKDVYQGGYTIQTTFNKTMQKQAEKAFVKQVSTLKKELSMPIDGGLLTIAVETGKVKTLIGGYDFTTSQFNRPFMAKRQMGSTIKPFIYAAAIQNGLSFDQVELDEPYGLSFQGTIWAPRNYNKKHLGFMTRAYALAHSNNIVAVKTLLATGISSVISMIEVAGLAINILPYPSLALGCIDVTLKQVVRAFNVFANGGLLVEPYFIEWIKDASDKKVWRYDIEKPKRLFSLSVASQVNAVLQYACAKVYKQKMAHEIIAKTGTTNKSTTCWIVGSSPLYTTGIYIGCDDNRSMGEHIFPVHTALPIWAELYALYSNLKPKFYYDRALQTAYINKWTGKPTSPADNDGIMILK